MAISARPNLSHRWLCYSPRWNMLWNVRWYKTIQNWTFLKKHSARDLLPAGHEICLDMFFVRQISHWFPVCIWRSGSVDLSVVHWSSGFFAARHADIEGWTRNTLGFAPTWNPGVHFRLTRWTTSSRTFKRGKTYLLNQNPFGSCSHAGFWIIFLCVGSYPIKKRMVSMASLELSPLQGI